MIKNIHVYGPFNGPTGYDHVVRGLVKEMYFDGINVGLFEFEKWSNEEIPISDLYEALKNRAPQVNSDVLLAFCLPEQLFMPNSPHHGKLLANFTMIETDKIPNNWASCGFITDLIIVPTEFNKTSWIESGVSEDKVVVCPLGIDTELFRPDNEPFPIFVSNYKEPIHTLFKNRFLNVQEVVDRKNLNGILRIWMDATKGLNNGEACLILKLSSYSENRLDYFEDRVKEARESIGVKKGDYAPIFVYLQMLNDLELASFFANSTHYLSMSFGEGWDLNLIAAASMGKQLVAPRGSSYLQYLNDNNAFLIDVSLSPAQQRGLTSRIYKDSNWHVPDEEHASSIIRDIIENGTKKKSMDEEVREKYSWSAVYKRLFNILENRFSYGHNNIKNLKRKNNNYIIVCKSASGSDPCGIAEYSRNLYNSIKKAMSSDKDAGVGLMAGPEGGYIDQVDKYKTGLVHFQYEYQFHSPVRLNYMMRSLKNRGVKIVLTQHTLNKEAVRHNEVIRDLADAVIVHSDYSKTYAIDELNFNEEIVHIVPMGFSSLFDKIDDNINVLPIIPDKKKIGFFGFTYFHKGILNLIKSFPLIKKKNPNYMLFILSFKPQQDTVGYYEQCRDILDYMGMVEREDYVWIDNFLPEEQIIKYLRQCELILLPYDNYGGIGTSAAIRTVMRAGRPVFASETCWFSDIPRDVVPNIDVNKLDECISNHIEYLENGGKNVLEEKIYKYVESNQWEKTAKKHIKIYQMLLG